MNTATYVARGCAIALLVVVTALGAGGCLSREEAGASEDDASMLPMDRAFLAASKGDVATLEELLNADPSLVHARGVANRTLLHMAAAAGENKAVSFLLERGLNPAMVDDNSSTTVDAALAEGHQDTADLILEWAQSHGGGIPPAGAQ